MLRSLLDGCRVAATLLDDPHNVLEPAGGRRKEHAFRYVRFMSEGNSNPYPRLGEC
jgi:hypothetical protein